MQMASGTATVAAVLTVEGGYLLSGRRRYHPCGNGQDALDLVASRERRYRLFAFGTCFGCAAHKTKNDQNGDDGDFGNCFGRSSERYQLYALSLPPHGLASIFRHDA